MRGLAKVSRNKVSLLAELCKGLKVTLLFLIITVINGAVYADVVDPTFDPQIQTNSFRDKGVFSIVVLPDGKMLAGGWFNSYNRHPTGNLVRLNGDATLDSTFNNTVITSGQVFKILIQTDGKILLMGYEMIVSGQTTPKFMIRVNADGAFDPSFNFTEGSTLDIALDAAGRVIASGVFSAGRKVIRLNPDGSRDTSFEYVSSPIVQNIATQNNKVVIINDGSPVLLRRLNEDGTIDGTFTQRNLIDYRAVPVGQPDGKIVVLDVPRLSRFNADGSDDTSFTPTTLPTNSGRHMALAADGKITIAYGATSPITIKRFLPSGVADPSFTPYDTNFYRSFALQPDGGVLVGDYFAGGISSPNHFERLFPNGSLDPTFNAGGIGFQTLTPGSVRAITVLPNGKIIIAGKFDQVNDLLRSKIARINSDSTIDPNFQIALGGAGNTFSSISNIYHVSAQADGKLLVSGNFTYTVNGTTKGNLVRLNTDGSIDPTFVLGVQLNDVYGCCLGGEINPIPLSDGKIIVGTSRISSNDPVVPLRLNSNGSHDSSFFAPIFSTLSVISIMDIAVQPDGKILIGGRSSTHSFIARLNSDGSTDQTFQVDVEANKEVAALALQSDGKILFVKGNWYGAATQQTRVLRLNTNGTPDNTFNAGTGASGRINAILALPGKIFIGGIFTSFNGQPRQNLAKLNVDGSLSPTIYNLNDEVLSLTADSNGRVLVGGNFTIISVGGGGNLNRTYLARLVDSRTRFDFDGDGRADIGVYSSLTRTWSILNSQTNQTSSTQFGLGPDKIAPADYDGDGKADIAVYRPSQGNWYLLRSTAGFGVVRFGAELDRPVPADYDGDGKADIAVWRPNTGDWWISQSSNGQLRVAHFGTSDDTPLPSVDFDGDGKADIAVWRPSNGNFYWLASGSGNQFRVVHFGRDGDIPAPADYNGDGKADLVVFRPSEGNWYQYLTTSTGSYTFSVIRFGLNGDEPVAADYNGDGRTDVAVRRNGVWHLLLSSQGYSVITFGNPAAQAIPALPWEVTIAGS